MLRVREGQRIYVSGLRGVWEVEEVEDGYVYLTNSKDTIVVLVACNHTLEPLYPGEIPDGMPEVVE